MEKLRRNMGSLIEEPALYGTLSGWDNLYNTTIIVSSHILSELYQFVDEYIFIDRGRIVEIIDQENLKNKIEVDHRINDSTSGEAGTLEGYFVNLIGEGRK